MPCLSHLEATFISRTMDSLADFKICINSTYGIFFRKYISVLELVHKKFRKHVHTHFSSL